MRNLGLKAVWTCAVMLLLGATPSGEIGSSNADPAFETCLICENWTVGISHVFTTTQCSPLDFDCGMCGGDNGQYGECHTLIPRDGPGNQHHPPCAVSEAEVGALVSAVRDHDPSAVDSILAASPKSYLVNRERHLIQILNAVGGVIAQIEVTDDLLSELH